MNKHQQRSEATKRKLLKAAQRIFSRDGFEVARIDDIAAEAGFTRGAFYAHFGSKEDLFFALLEQTSTMHLDKVRSLMESCASESERLETLRTYYATRAVDRQWSILLLEFKLFAVRHPKLRAKLVEARRRIRTKMQLKSIGGLLPAQFQSFEKSKEVRRAALEAVLSGIVLEQAYDPKSITAEQATSILGRLFDTLVQGFDTIS